MRPYPSCQNKQAEPKPPFNRHPGQPDAAASGDPPARGDEQSVADRQRESHKGGAGTGRGHGERTAVGLRGLPGPRWGLADLIRGAEVQEEKGRKSTQPEASSSSF